jgi:hypothetical protein
MNKITIIVSALAVGASLAISLALLVSNPAGDATPDGCFPTSLSQIDQTTFPIREPNKALVSDSASLQAVDENIDLVTMYYADFSLCPFQESLDSFLQKGGVIVTISKPDRDYKDSTEFQELQLAYYTSNPEIVADVKPIEVNSYKGVGWGPYEGASVLKIDGKVVESTPFPGSGTVRFYNEMDGTVFLIKADRPLDQILTIAESMK